MGEFKRNIGARLPTRAEWQAMDERARRALEESDGRVERFLARKGESDG